MTLSGGMLPQTVSRAQPKGLVCHGGSKCNLRENVALHIEVVSLRREYDNTKLSSHRVAIGT